jgi:hypothetical protein
MRCTVRYDSRSRRIFPGRPNACATAKAMAREAIRTLRICRNQNTSFADFDALRAWPVGPKTACRGVYCVVIRCKPYIVWRRRCSMINDCTVLSTMAWQSVRGLRRGDAPGLGTRIPICLLSCTGTLNATNMRWNHATAAAGLGSGRAVHAGYILLPGIHPLLLTASNDT